MHAHCDLILRKFTKPFSVMYSRHSDPFSRRSCRETGAAAAMRDVILPHAQLKCTTACTLAVAFLMSSHVLVTGASSGIGLALCKLLVRDHGCHVYLGSRSAAKGEACVKQIVSEVPSASGKIEMLQLDVTDDASVIAASSRLQSRGVTLYAVVNNAGVGLAQVRRFSFEANSTNISSSSARCPQRPRRHP